MLHSLALEPVADNPAFERIVATTQWENSGAPTRLRVAASLGWLVGIGKSGGPESLIGFSMEAVERDESTGPLLPPHNLPEVKIRLESPLVTGLFNTDMTAKGIGSVMANTPRALQPDSVREAGIAVREVSFVSPDDLYTRDESDTPLGQILRLGRHGVLLGGSAIVDKVTQSTIGTEEQSDLWRGSMARPAWHICPHRRYGRGSSASGASLKTFRPA